MKRLPFLVTFVSILAGMLIAFEADIHGVVVALGGAALLYLLYRRSGLDREDIGAKKVSKNALFWCAAIFGSVFMLSGIAYLAVPDIFMDERYNQSLASTILSMFVMLPLTTVLLEEFAFRGLLLGYLLKSDSRARALLVSSTLFGLWHITSSFYIDIDSFLFIQNPPQVIVSLVIVLVTGAAGWVFSILRLKTHSILVPIVAHWSFNALGMLFAWLAWRG